MGPEIETAAMTRPDGARTGADTDATPGSRSPTLCAQPRRRTPERAVAVKAAPCRPRCRRSGSSQASSTWAADPARMDSVAPTGMESRRPDRALGGGDAHAVLALPAVELGALVGVVAKRTEHRAGSGQQAVLPGGRGELTETRPEHETALQVAGHEAVVLECDGQSVRRRAGEAGGRDELCERGRTGLEGTEDDAALSRTPTPLVSSIPRY